MYHYILPTSSHLAQRAFAIVLLTEAFSPYLILLSITAKTNLIAFSEFALYLVYFGSRQRKPF